MVIEVHKKPGKDEQDEILGYTKNSLKNKNGRFRPGITKANLFKK